MFKEMAGSQNIKSNRKDEGNEFPKEFLNWEEKNSYVAQKLVSEKLGDVLAITDNLVDSRGDFFDFLKTENIEQFSQIFREIAADIKIKGGLYDPKYNVTFGEKAVFDSDYGRIFTEALPAIFQNNLEKGIHNNNLTLIQAWAQVEDSLMDAEDRASNIANIRESFKISLNDNRISVLEKIYLNYIGQQLNQSDADDLRKFLPEVYEEFKDEQPNIDRFRKEVPSDFNLNLPLDSRRFLLLAKHCPTSISSPENDWREEYIKVEKLSPCRGEINPMELMDADGEYLVADFSPDYDGVYSLSGSLEAFIKKGDLNSEKIVTARDFSEVKKEINFYNNQGVASFKVMSSLFFRDALEKKCGIDITQLNLRTQYQFLNFVSEYSEDKFSELKEFMNNSVSIEEKNNRLKSFLCLELDKKLGDQIITLGKKLEPAQADLFFSKVAAINDLACKEESELGRLLLKDNQDLDFSILKSELLKRARDLVIKFSTLTDGKLSEDESNNIFVELENVKTEMVLFSSLLKSAKDNGQNINLEIIKDLNLRVKDYGESIDAKDKVDVLNIAQANWSSFGNEKMAAVVLKGLAESLENDKDQRAYILKYKGEVIGFVRFEKTDHDTIYAGSFNVSKDLRGLSIGNDLMEKVLVEEGKNNALEAAASIKTSVGCSYVEKIDFVVDGIISDYHQTGEILFTIKLDNENNKNYAFKNKENSEEQLKKVAKEARYLDDLIGQESFVLRFDLNSETSEYEESLNKLLAKADDSGNKLESLSDKYTITRYFYDKQEDERGNIRYLVFEKNR